MITNIFGKQGSGKTTLARFLADRLRSEEVGTIEYYPYYPADNYEADEMPF